MSKMFKLCGLLLAGMIAVIGFNSGVFARITGSVPTYQDVFCVGPDSYEVCVDYAGNVVPTTTDNQTSGSSSYRWSNVYTTLLNVSSTLTASAALNVAGTTTFSGNTLGKVATIEGIASDATITANACGGIKRIKASPTGAAPTTNTTNTFTSPTALAGCAMDIVNVGTTNITLDSNALFITIGAQDQVLGSSDTIRVATDGNIWYQIGTLGNNS